MNRNATEQKSFCQNLLDKFFVNLEKVHLANDSLRKSILVGSLNVCVHMLLHMDCGYSFKEELFEALIEHEYAFPEANLHLRYALYRLLDMSLEPRDRERFFSLATRIHELREKFGKEIVVEDTWLQ